MKTLTNLLFLMLITLSLSCSKNDFLQIERIQTITLRMLKILITRIMIHCARFKALCLIRVI